MSKIITALLVAGMSLWAAPSIAKAPQPVVRHAKHLHVGQVLIAKRAKNIRHYQWQRCGMRGRACKNIKGATHYRYRVTRRDVGHRLRVRESIATATGVTTVVSDPTPVIAPPDPVNTSLPTISGVAAQGQTLTASPGTWQNAVSFTYQWEDCDVNGANCSLIAGATSTTYVLQASDVGHTIRVAVTAHNSQAAARAISPRA